MTAVKPPFFPNYDDGILSLSQSLLKHYGVPTPYPSLSDLDAILNRPYKNVVLMIFDGMGTDLMERLLLPDSFLRRHLIRPISSVFPPTTCAAMTTYRSGLPPIVHGWLAWACYFKEYDKVIELYRDTDVYTQQKLTIPPVADKLAYTPIWEKIAAATEGQVKTEVIYPAFLPNGVKDVPEMCRRITDIGAESGRHFIFTYWPYPDSLCHKIGPFADDIRDMMRDIDGQMAELAQHLTDTLIIISADHGHIPIEDVVYVDDCADMTDCFARPLSLDDRTVSVALKPGCEERFLDLFNRYLSADFVLISRQEALDKGLFGTGTPHPRAIDFIGDYLIASVSGKSIRQHMPDEVIPDLKGAHAGLTRAEMQVPLIVVET